MSVRLFSIKGGAGRALKHQPASRHIGNGNHTPGTSGTWIPHGSPRPGISGKGSEFHTARTRE